MRSFLLATVAVLALAGAAHATVACDNQGNCIIPSTPPAPQVQAPAPPAVQQPQAQPEPEQPEAIGWVYGPYLRCNRAGCVVDVNVDGMNVRRFPNGPIIAALVNGTPLTILDQQGKWVQVYATCQLHNTSVWSDTAGVFLFAC